MDGSVAWFLGCAGKRMTRYIRIWQNFNRRSYIILSSEGICYEQLVLTMPEFYREWYF
jgi:hypothetical protein